MAMSNVLFNSSLPNAYPPKPEQRFGGSLSFLDLEPSIVTSLTEYPARENFFKKKGRITGHSHFLKLNSAKNNRKETQRKSTETEFPCLHVHAHTHARTHIPLQTPQCANTNKHGYT